MTLATALALGDGVRLISLGAVDLIIIILYFALALGLGALSARLCQHQRRVLHGGKTNDGVIGLLLAVYGVLILGVGVYDIFVPSSNTAVLSNLHLAIWWGGGILLSGTIFVVRFRPSKT